VLAELGAPAGSRAASPALSAVRGDKVPKAGEG